MTDEKKQPVLNDRGYPSVLMMDGTPQNMFECANGMFESFADGKPYYYNERKFLKQQFTEVVISWMAFGREKELEQLLNLIEPKLNSWDNIVNQSEASESIRVEYSVLYRLFGVTMYQIKVYLNSCRLVRFVAKVSGHDRQSWRDLLMVAYEIEKYVSQDHLDQKLIGKLYSALIYFHDNLPPSLKGQNLIRGAFDGLSKVGLIGTDGELSLEGRMVAQYLLTDHQSD